jgi:hypothetical protein
MMGFASLNPSYSSKQAVNSTEVSRPPRGAEAQSVE